MNQSIASEAKHRQRVVKFSFKHGVLKASIRFHRCRQVIYNWRKRYDGKSWKSLVEHSNRPKSHPRQHTAEEIDLMLRHYPYYKDDVDLQDFSKLLNRLSGMADEMSSFFRHIKQEKEH